MHEITTAIESIAVFVGTGACNARCAHCAGIPLREYAPEKDFLTNAKKIEDTLHYCYERGARSLSITSSGEPTLSPHSVSQVLDIVQSMHKREQTFRKVNLYSNGIIIGTQPSFCQEYLGTWKEKGLTTIYITVHNVDEQKNAIVYGVHAYPPLATIIERVHAAELSVRANVILANGNIDSAKEFEKSVKKLLRLNVDSIAAWPLRTLEDTVDTEKSPSHDIIRDMQERAQQFPQVRVYDEESRERYRKGRKVTLFPDGTLASTWCN